MVALCLAGRWYEAAQKMWPDYIVANENTERLFKALGSNQRLLVMGHGSASKTFSTMAFFLLKYWVKPRLTSVTVTGATLTSLKPRAWADLKLLIAKAAVPLGLQVLDSRLVIRAPPMRGPDNAEIVDDKHTIECVAAEHKDSQSKVQGRHAEETCLVIEEADNRMSESVWTAESNLATSGNFQVVALANPFDRSSKFGQACQPENGWDNADPDTWKEWDTHFGHVVRMDGFDCPNYKAKKTIVPFLLRWEWFEETLRTKGEMSPEWWAYGRGWFPPTGVSAAIWPLEVINAALGRKLEFYAYAERIAALDPAFEGGDKCVLLVGRLGRMAGAVHRPALMAEEWVYLKRRDLSIPVTHDIAHQVMEELSKREIPPEKFIMDGTGNAIGLRDVLAMEWVKELGRKVNFRSVVFAGNPTEEKILAEDSRKASERFDRLVTEMCHASMEWARSGCLGVMDAPPDLRLQLEARLGSLGNRRNQAGEALKRAETKVEMRARGYHSPDEYDVLNLLVHLARALNPASLNASLSLVSYGDPAAVSHGMRRLGRSSLPSSLPDDILAASLKRNPSQSRNPEPTYASPWSDSDDEAPPAS